MPQHGISPQLSDLIVLSLHIRRAGDTQGRKQAERLPSSIDLGCGGSAIRHFLSKDVARKLTDIRQV
jgi:hypothetical protein